MTSDEAFETLGVLESATATEARRAYMRLIKKHKPEKDPEGFKRAREAYDVAKEAIASREFLAQFSDEDEDEDELNGDDAAGALTGAPEAQARSQDPAPPAIALADAPDPLATFHELATSAETEAESLTVWREACAEHPGAADAWDELVNGLLYADLDEEAGEAAVKALAAGHTEFKDRVLAWAQRPSEALMREAWEDPDLRSSALAGIVQWQRVDDAETWVKALLDAPEFADDLSVGTGSSYTTLGLLHLLVVKGRWALARRLNERVAHSFSGERKDLAVQEPNMIARWALTTELLEVAELLPNDVAVAFARLTADQGDEDLAGVLWGLRRRERSTHTQLLKTLNARAPRLYTIAEALNTAQAETKATGSGWGLGWGAFIVLFFLFRAISSSLSSKPADSSRTPSVDPPLERTRAQTQVEPTAGTQAPSQSTPNLAGTPDRERLVKSVVVLSAVAAHDFADAASWARELLDAFDARDCRKLELQLAGLEQVRGAPPPVPDRFQMVWGEFVVMCPEHRPETDP